MKYLLIIALCITPLLATEGYEDRTAISCEGDNQYGYYWDVSQKCEPCSDSNCSCSKTYTCDECKPLYVQFTPQWISADEKIYNNDRCIPCAQGYGSNVPTTNCCISAGIASDSEPTYTTTGYYAIRSTECNQDYTGEGQWYKTGLYGSVCHNEKGCSEFNDVGLCTTCMDGYYLDEDQTCQYCTGYNGTNNAWQQICTKCSGPNECEACQDGYYLVTLEKASSYDKIKDNPSICQPCDAHCKCSGGNQGKDTCDIGCTTDTYYWDADKKTCTACTTLDTNCVTCQDANTCLTCKGRSQKPAAYGLTNKYEPKGKACIQGPDYCHDFTINDDLTTYCNASGCDNGTYEADPAAGASGVVCTQCKSGKNAIRCSSETVFTQCGSSTTVPNQQPGMTVPNENTFFLIDQNVAAGENATETVCQKNASKCKEMISPVDSDKAGQCKECYTEYGYVKTTTTFKCLLCTAQVTNCTACQANETDGLDCTACSNGADKVSWAGSVPNYYLASATTCTACKDGCKTCTDTACSACQSGWVSDGNSSCTKCTIENCSACALDTATTKCTTCFSNYVISSDGTECLPCNTTGKEALCTACSTDRLSCTACIAGYQVKNGACQKWQPNCITQDGGVCSLCTYGFRVTHGYCREAFLPTSEAYVNLDSGCDANSRYQADRLWLPASSSLLHVMMTAMLLIFAIILI